MSKFSIHMEIITIIMSRFFNKQTQWTKKNNIRKFTMFVISKYYQCFCQMWYGKKKCNVLQKLSMGKVQSCNNKLFLVDLPLLHLVMELHLLFLWSKKRLELEHGITLTMLHWWWWRHCFTKTLVIIFSFSLLAIQEHPK